MAGGKRLVSKTGAVAGAAGVALATDPVTANEAPDGDAVSACEALGAALA